MSTESPSSPGRTQAAMRRTWWPGWIWALPIAALILVGWWGFRRLASGGENIVITFEDSHGLKESSGNVLYRGMKIGAVSGIALAKDGSSVEVTAHIDGNATRFLKSGTRFWLRGAEPSLSNLSALSSILTGPSIEMMPGPGAKTTRFTGLMRRPLVADPAEKPVVYAVSLPDAVGGLQPGQPVSLKGFTVGEVKTVGFRYDAATGTIETPVTLALYPSLFHIKDNGSAAADAALLHATARLVQQGLRATLQRDPPLVGTPQVALDIVPGAPAPRVADKNGMPAIPVGPSDGLSSVVARVNKLPIEQIGDNLLQVSRQANAIVASPKLEDAIAQLDATLEQLHQTTGQAGPKITQLVDALRHAADQLDTAVRAVDRTAHTASGTMQAADRMLGGTPSQNGMPDAVRELTDAARSVRDLANYLDRHPEAMVRGRDSE